LSGRGARVAAGYQVLGVNPPPVSRYWERHSTSSAKSGSERRQRDDPRRPSAVQDPHRPRCAPHRPERGRESQKTPTMGGCGPVPSPGHNGRASRPPTGHTPSLPNLSCKQLSHRKATTGTLLHLRRVDTPHWTTHAGHQVLAVTPGLRVP
jgi:hypothetical protein